MDVDHPARQFPAESFGEHLHVAGQDDEIDVVLGHEPEQRGFGVQSGGRGHGHVLEGDAVPGHRRTQIRMVGDDDRDVDRELAGPPAVEKVDQAVVVLGDHHEDARPPVFSPHHKGGPERLRSGS